MNLSVASIRKPVMNELCEDGMPHEPKKLRLWVDCSYCQTKWAVSTWTWM